MQLTRIAIYRPIATSMIALALIFLGVISFRELAVQQFPDVTRPSMYYSVWMEESDLSPEETNDALTRPFEKMVASLAGVREMVSNTSAGSFDGNALFERGTDMRFRVIELQDQAAKWAAGKPGRVRTFVTPGSIGDQSGQLMELVLSVPAGMESRSGEVTDLIKRKLKSIDGISQVQIQGDVAASVMLEAERDILHAAGLDTRQLLDAINARAAEKQWLGTLKDGPKEHSVQLDAKVQDLAQLQKIPVDKGGIYSIGAVTRLRRSNEERESIYRTNGKKAVHVNVSMEKSRNAIRMAGTVRARLDEIRRALPPGFELIVLNDAAQVLEEMMKHLSQMAMTGAFLAMLVLLVFIRDVRVATVVLITIPASILITFNIMYGMGLTINILSLMGLTAGVGMLVDNSIVVVENVFRHWRHRDDAREAAWLGSREVGRAILISTSTNLIVFVPLMFIDDDAVVLMREMALSLIFPMTISLLAAITLIPMLTAQMLGMRHRGTGGSPVIPATGEPPVPQAWRKARILQAGSLRVRWNPWQQAGRPPRNFFREFIYFCAKASIRHPIRLFFTIVVILLVTLFAGMIKLAIQRPEMQQQTQTLTVYGKTPLGSDLAAADRFFQEKEKRIRAEMAGSDVFEYFTSSFTKEGGQIDLAISKKYQSLWYWDFYFAYRKKFTSGDDRAGFRLRPFRDLRSQGAALMKQQSQSNSSSEQALVTGENYDAMLLASAQVQDALRKEADVGEVTMETPPGQPEVQFAPDIEMFRMLATDPSRIGLDISARDTRGIDTALVLNEGGLDEPVRIKVLEPKELDKSKVRQTLGELRRTRVPLSGGGAAPLETLGSFSMRQAASMIVKKDRQRNLPISFNLRGNFYKTGMEKQRQDALKKIQENLGKLRLPLGVSVQMGGSLEAADTEALLWKKVLWSAVLGVYFVMAFFFESLLAPLIVLWTLPLALIGGIWGVILCGGQLDTVALLGSIILAGLVVNNGILLIEYTRQLQDGQRYRRARALLSAIAYRVRPIMMTSLTTILGLLPILFSHESVAVARSLAAVLIGGIIVSTLLTLVVVPTYYNVATIGMARLGARWGRLRMRVAGLRGRRGRSGRSGRSGPSGRAPGRGNEIPPDQMRIEIMNVSKVYPLFTKKKLVSFVPSRSYPFGHRPPNGNAALKNVDLTIEPGMFGLLGPNGAGKTTLMKIITGIIPQSYGVVRVCGRDLRADRLSVRSLISYLPQNFGVYEALTLDQYLEFFAPFYGLNDRAERRRRIAEAAEWVGLEGVRDKPMKRFSGGMRQRAGIAQLLLNPAPIIIVDEPTAGLDPVERVRFRLLLAQLARTRIVLLSTHIVDDITSSCRQVAVLSRGSVVYQGDLEQIKATAHGTIWDVLHPADQPAPVPERYVLYKKHVGGQILYHYTANDPVPGSHPVEASFEDAYVALLMRNESSRRK